MNKNTHLPIIFANDEVNSSSSAFKFRLLLFFLKFSFSSEKFDAFEPREHKKIAVFRFASVSPT